MGPSILFFLAGVVAVGIAGAVYKVNRPQAGYQDATTQTNEGRLIIGGLGIALVVMTPILRALRFAVRFQNEKRRILRGCPQARDSAIDLPSRHRSTPARD